MEYVVVVEVIVDVDRVTSALDECRADRHVINSKDARENPSSWNWSGLSRYEALEVLLGCFAGFAVRRHPDSNDRIFSRATAPRGRGALWSR